MPIAGTRETMGRGASRLPLAQAAPRNTTLVRALARAPGTQQNLWGIIPARIAQFRRGRLWTEYLLA